MMKIFAALFLISVTLSSPQTGFAKPVCKNAVAKVVSAQGKVLVQNHGAEQWRTITRNDQICPGDTLRTSKWSRATIVFSSKNIVTLDQNTTLNFPAPQEQTVSWLLKVFEGVSFFRSRQPQKLQVQTPFINAVHEGTEFIVAVGKDKAEISVLDGKVAAVNMNGKVGINKGEAGIAESGKAPVVRALKVTPQDAVQWSLFYPPLIDYSETAKQAEDGLLHAALTAYEHGDVAAALNALAALPAAHNNSRVLNLKAGLMLTVGRIDEAEPLIRRVQELEPDNSEALALQAVIAVAANRQQEALELANKAVSVKSDSVVAKIAQSYAYQSLFDIDMALKAAQDATRLAPNNALAWARRAELQLSKGDHTAALTSARKAQALNPNLASSQTVLGFANLAETEIGEAKRAFEQAMTLDSSDPLARLGLGLTLIRQGDVEAGKDELEAAVNLDPNNAVTRSYLGKAYYELRNKDYAGKEFEIAKSMDPKDPTPYFYDAILKQTINRPVESLHDMQKAIELNDNRGVYRSSLLLDKDLAARSAAQGRIYSELGFQQRGLLEGWKSVNQDSTNYSAHRLLADSYAALPRHELARVSELLQSQLMQPVNVTPIQPNLAESNLFVLNGLGPSDLSYNEFNPLFEYNRLALQSSWLYGGNNTWGDNTTFSGMQGDTSFSLGQFHFESDGFRENNFQKKDLYNVFAQQRITENLNLQAEYRHEERSNGDLSHNFYSENFSENFNQKIYVDSYRLGGHYLINSNSSIIGSLIYQNMEAKGVDVDVEPFSSDLDGFIAELQHSLHYSDFSLINGFGHINQNGVYKPFLQLAPDFKIGADIAKTNFYNYTKYNISNEIRATFGVSFDFLNIQQGKPVERNRVNPKFGVEWNPSLSTTVRATVFRNMNMSQVASQTIEPTQVAGFNQFFDDYTGTVAWRYGAGLDHKFSKNITSGLEYSERKLDFIAERSLDRSEQLARAYTYITPLDQLSLGAEYYYERISAPFFSTGPFKLVETHRLPLSFNFFHPSGLSFKIKSSFVHQSGLFKALTSAAIAPDNSDFVVVDLNLNYRFPKRFGIISFGVNNLFDEKFKYQNTSIFNPLVNTTETILAPSRLIYSRVTFAF